MTDNDTVRPIDCWVRMADLSDDRLFRLMAHDGETVYTAEERSDYLPARVALAQNADETTYPFPMPSVLVEDEDGPEDWSGIPALESERVDAISGRVDEYDDWLHLQFMPTRTGVVGWLVDEEWADHACTGDGVEDVIGSITLEVTIEMEDGFR